MVGKEEGKNEIFFFFQVGRATKKKYLPEFKIQLFSFA